MLASTVAVDPAAAAASYELLVMPAALVLSTVVLSSALAQSERAHRRQSTIDSLTGVFNRSALDQRVSELEATAQNGPSPAMSFLLCDLDHFKRVNDEHGHSVGDTVLREAAYAIRRACAPPTPSTGSAAKSSSQSSRAPTRQGPSRSPIASGRRLRPSTRWGSR